MDTKSHELLRVLKLADTTISVISMTQPRKQSEVFADDLYPDCLSQTPAQSAEEWFDGTNKLPLRQSLRPSSAHIR